MSDNTDTIRIHAVVEGRVQGVFFRAHTRDEAVKLGLAGWVRNRSDGAVEAVAEGPRPAVEEMVQWLHKGSPHSQVENVTVTEESPQGEFSTFEIRYT